MVQVLSLFLATLATIGPVVQAVSCTPGLNYCGHTLQANGWRGMNRDRLYHCDKSGHVSPVKNCPYPGCTDGRRGRSDYCWRDG
ncbi:hypothetical protein E4U22_005144 [Claviceps purpurea]|nr:hypothetical protein E4U38_008400 [Claviceps purpurea]KAG6228815.1 hypothetical protein E4U26_000719 [Claviceps purpurea]KAG6323847.1 hypothetical protein E4U22_005144 [Claviceps purpurea]